jgi:hypothetical protein
MRFADLADEKCEWTPCARCRACVQPSRLNIRRYQSVYHHLLGWKRMGSFWGPRNPAALLARIQSNDPKWYPKGPGEGANASGVSRHRGVLWFAAPLGVGSLIVPAVLFEHLFAVTGFLEFSRQPRPLGFTAKLVIQRCRKHRRLSPAPLARKAWQATPTAAAFAEGLVPGSEPPISPTKN